MENASKALIIAASVLVAILIVAMGVTIFNRAQNSADMTSLDTTEINMFNSKFERYADNQLGSQVKSLISFAISNASTNKDDPSKLPTINLTNSDKYNAGPVNGSTDASNAINTYVTNLGTIRNAIVSTHTYKVTCNYAGSGLISEIIIDYNT